MIDFKIQCMIYKKQHNFVDDVCFIDPLQQSDSIAPKQEFHFIMSLETQMNMHHPQKGHDHWMNMFCDTNHMLDKPTCQISPFLNL